jgi:hypothetical protein
MTEKWVDEKGKPGTNSSMKTSEGDFNVIYDEAILMTVKKKETMTNTSRKTSVAKK